MVVYMSEKHSSRDFIIGVVEKSREKPIIGIN